MTNNPHTIDLVTYTRCSRYWLEDGSLILHSCRILYKVHKSLLLRHSPNLSRWINQQQAELSVADEQLLPDIAGCTHITVPDEIGLRTEDLEALLEHLYHDVPLSAESPFSRVASLLRASSPKQLHFPAIHELCGNYILMMFPSSPRPFFHPDFLHDALILATEFDLPMRKGILYSLVTTSDFDMEGDETEGRFFSEKLPLVDGRDDASQMPNSCALSPTDAQKCRRLMGSIMEHFTPILFTPATTPHMACTNVFADRWMPLVIQPALDSAGVYKPLETLQNIIDIDWREYGLCSSCAIEKRAEWTKEQEDVWEKMDEWIA